MNRPSAAAAASSATARRVTGRPAGTVVQWRATRIAETQGALALDLEPRREPPDQRRYAGAGRDGVVDLPDRRRRELERWVGRFAQAAVEIVGGDRPASQLVRWTSPEVYADLRRRAVLVARAGGQEPGVARVQPARPAVQSVHTCVVSAGVAESCFRVRYGARSRAVAARFEHRRGHWLCTALDFS